MIMTVHNCTYFFSEYSMQWCPQRQRASDQSFENREQRKIKTGKNILSLAQFTEYLKAKLSYTVALSGEFETSSQYVFIRSLQKRLSSFRRTGSFFKRFFSLVYILRFKTVRRFLFIICELTLLHLKKVDIKTSFQAFKILKRLRTQQQRGSSFRRINQPIYRNWPFADKM